MKRKFHRRIKKLKEKDVTDYDLYLNRKQFLKKTAITAVSTGLLLSPSMEFLLRTSGPGLFAEGQDLKGLRKLYPVKSLNYAGKEDQTSLKYVSGYNNFYEFSTDKEEVAPIAENFITSPWRVRVEGEVENKGSYHIDDLIRPKELEERIYRLRCVEGWSMVIPWIGVPLYKILNRLKPNSNARYVEFTTLMDPDQMPGQKRSVLDWPYVEGLRLDEAMHPLTILAVGLYGRILPNQNGAPIRLVVPWKYGFKSIKSIVKIKLTRKQPGTTWALANPREYGFYSNVNPNVDHPRWSQARERRIGEFRKRETLMFNGYGDEVGYMYKNMDLKKKF